jgi:hypothetical protein
MRAMPFRRAWLPDLLAFSVPGALTLGIATELTRPVTAGPVSFDVGGEVIHFERLVHGHRLEQYLTTTPKPILTFVYGLLHAWTDDWRAISWASILAFGLAVALLTLVVRRVAGTAPAAFVGIGLAGSALLLEDVGLALGWGWALLFLACAAAALTQPAPRYAVAGFAMAAAVLVRIELLVVVAGIGLVLVVAALVPRLPRPPRGAWFLLLGGLALPVMLLHDALLIGDPLFWAKISGYYSAGAPDLRDIGELAAAVWARYRAIPLLVILAVLGVVELLRMRQWALGTGLLLLGPGIAAFMFFLALRGTFVPDRYLIPVDASLIVAAGFSLHAVRLRPAIVAATRRVVAPLRATLLAAGVALLAIIITPTWALIDAPARTVVFNQRWLMIDLRAVLPVLRAEVEERPAIRAFPAGDGDGEPTFFVPVRARPMIAADLGLPLTEVASTFGPNIDLGAGYPRPGQVLFHDMHGERYLVGFEPFQIDAPVEVGGVRLVPLAANPDRGYWVVAIEPGA